MYDGGRTHASPRRSKISLDLLPKETNPEPLHMRRKIIRNILHHFGPGGQRVEEMGLSIYKTRGKDCLDDALNHFGHMRLVTAGVGCAEEDQARGGCVY